MMKGLQSRAGGEPPRYQRVHRTIDQTAVVARSFVDVADIVERHRAAMLEQASAAASSRSKVLMADADVAIDGFDPHERLTVAVLAPPTRSAQQVTVEFGWSGDRERRLLANAQVRLDFHPLTSRGRRRGTTEVRMRAEYDPPAGARYSPEAILFGRRVVRAALLVLLDEIVRFLEDYEETLELRIQTEHRPEPALRIQTEHESVLGPAQR